MGAVPRGCGTAFSWGVRRAGCGFLSVFSTAGERPSGCFADYGASAGNSRTPQRSAGSEIDCLRSLWAMDTRTAIPPHPDGLAIRSSQICMLSTLQPPPWGVHGPYIHIKVASLTAVYSILTSEMTMTLLRCALAARRASRNRRRGVRKTGRTCSAFHPRFK